MEKIRSSFLARFLSFIAIALFVVPLNAAAVAASEKAPTTKIDYDPIEYFVPEKRIELLLEVEDEAGVKIVRCYFLADSQADYVFVPMNVISENTYRGILPAPSKDTQQIKYLFLVVNGNDQVVKTQTFKVNKKDEEKAPAWQTASADGNVQVYTELPQAAQPPAGFTDSIAMDVVESSARFGFVVGGIYAATQIAAAGGTSGAAAAATAAGTVTVSAGLSTAAIVGIVAAATAVVAGGAAAVAGGSSSSKSSPSPPPTPPTPPTPPPINAKAGVEWGDYGPAKDDQFQVWFGSRNLGTNPTGKSSGVKTVSGLEVGSHTLRIKCLIAPDNSGTYGINLSGGATFSGGYTNRTGSLKVNESKSYSVTVPKP